MKKFDARKILLLCGLMLSFLYGRSQIIVFVQEPPGLVGSYDFTWAAPPPDGNWGSPDLNDPANAVTDTLAFVDDGTAGDSLGCDTLVNGSAITGKIAVVYRGSCEFGFKALMAQNEGAVAVVIINHTGAPVPMGEGTYGGSVTIPVVMISQGDGALLRDEIDAGNVVAFIGNISNQFPNNLGIYRGDAWLPKHSATPKQVCTSAAEYAVSPGCWVQNNGVNDQTGVVLTADVSLGGSSVYNQTTAPVDIASGDSVFLTLPDFTQPGYQGLYTLTYSTSSDSTENVSGDNNWSMDFLIDSLLAYGGIDPATHQPINGTHYKPDPQNGPLQTCVHFRDANASRLGALGMYVSTAASGTDSVTGDLIEIFAYEWNDVFNDINDAVVSDLNTVADGEYTYGTNQEFTNIFVPFSEPLALVDDQRYLFCMSTSNTDLYHGCNEVLDYVENLALPNAQPTTIIDNGGTWEILGFGPDVSSAIGVRMISVEHIGIEEPDQHQLSARPNPTSDLVRIPLPTNNGDARLEIMDLDGAVVAQRTLVLTGGELVMDVTNLRSGTYVFKVTPDDGNVISFKVVVTK